LGPTFTVCMRVALDEYGADWHPAVNNARPSIREATPYVFAKTIMRSFISFGL